MSRTAPVFDHLRSRRLLDVAVDLFDRFGYHGTTVRDIASSAGTSVPALYEVFASKQSILLEIVEETYGAAIAQMEAAVADAGDEPAACLEAAVRAQCEFHVRRQRACRVAERELVNLEPDDRRRAAEQRARAGQILHEIMGEGASRGAFDVREPEATSRALASMCVAIGSWYDPGGHVVPRQIAQTYCDLAEKMAGVRFRPAVRRDRRRGLAPVPVPVTA
jgi:AcrR family transcriptional regulator